MAEIDTSAPQLGDTMQIMDTLMRIQELFYDLSSHKDGPNAGKVNKDQLKESKFDSAI